MGRFVIRRLLQSVLILIGVSLLTFFILRLAPGGPTAIYLQDPRMRRADIEAIEERLGLREPLPVQYLRWLAALARLDLGRSYSSNRPVLSVILERVPATLQLSLAGMVLGVSTGILFGVVAALRRDSLIDHISRVASGALFALPDWWIGLVLLLFLGGTLGLVPLGGMATIGKGDLADRLWHLALPACVQALGWWALLQRVTRTGILEVLGEDYVRTAHAKGLLPSIISRRHVLKPALLPLVTIIGAAIGTLLSGALIIEYTFSWPGLGRLAVEAIGKRDYPLLMGLTIIGSILVILGNLIADLAYGWLDPRVRYE